MVAACLLKCTTHEIIHIYIFIQKDVCNYLFRLHECKIQIKSTITVCLLTQQLSGWLLCVHTHTKTRHKVIHDIRTFGPNDVGPQMINGTNSIYSYIWVPFECYIFAPIHTNKSTHFQDTSAFTRTFNAVFGHLYIRRDDNDDELSLNNAANTP